MYSLPITSVPTNSGFDFIDTMTRELIAVGSYERGTMQLLFNDGTVHECRNGMQSLSFLLKASSQCEF